MVIDGFHTEIKKKIKKYDKKRMSCYFISAVGAIQQTFSAVPLLAAAKGKVIKIQSEWAGSQSSHCQLSPFRKEKQFEKQNYVGFFVISNQNYSFMVIRN